MFFYSLYQSPGAILGCLSQRGSELFRGTAEKFICAYLFLVDEAAFLNAAFCWSTFVNTIRTNCLSTWHTGHIFMGTVLPSYSACIPDVLFGFYRKADVLTVESCCVVFLWYVLSSRRTGAAPVGLPWSYQLCRSTVGHMLHCRSLKNKSLVPRVFVRQEP